MSRKGRKSRNPPSSSGQIGSPGSSAKAVGGHYFRVLVAFLAGGAITAAGFSIIPSRKAAPRSDQANSAVSGVSSAETAIPRSYHDLLAMTPDELARVDIAVANLLCAKALPGSESLNIPAAIKRLDEWAAKVKAETERHLYRVTDPKYAEHYQHSEARLRAEFLVQVLQEDCGVHYNMARIRDVDFSNPKDMFILGMIDDPNGGTCASMPVLYVAVGRRLGYPMKLALAKQHVYCRWEGEREQLNIDGAANGGLDFPADEEYRKWPEPISDGEMATREFLRSLTPSEELSLFMLNRGCVLHARENFAEAIACFAESHRLMPSTTGPKAAVTTALAGRPMPGQTAPVAQTPQRPPAFPPPQRGARRLSRNDPDADFPGVAGSPSPSPTAFPPNNTHSPERVIKP